MRVCTAHRLTLSTSSDLRIGLNRSKINGKAPLASTTGKSSGIGFRNTLEPNPWKSLSGVSKDPKSRARSREYLSQCLQEVMYLTSPGALNPLPPRAPVSVDEAKLNKDHHDSTSADQSSYERPKKSIPEETPASMFAKKPEPTQQEEPLLATSSSSSLPNGSLGGEDTNAQAGPSIPPPKPQSPLSDRQSHSMELDPTARPPSSPSPNKMELPDANDLPESQGENGEEPEQQLLTAIYRPDSKAAWREELRAANEKAEKVCYTPARFE